MKRYLFLLADKTKIVEEELSLQYQRENPTVFSVDLWIDSEDLLSDDGAEKAAIAFGLAEAFKAGYVFRNSVFTLERVADTQSHYKTNKTMSFMCM